MASSYPLVVRVMLEFKAALLAQEANQIEEMASRWLQMEQALQGSMDALAFELDQLRNQGETITAGSLLRSERYQRLIAQVVQYLDRYTTYADGRIQSGQRELIQAGINHAVEAIQAYYAMHGRAARAFDILPSSTFESAVGLAGNREPTKNLLRDASAIAVEGLATQLLKAAGSGRAVPEMVQSMQSGLGTGFHRVINTARTEPWRLYLAASLMQYQSSGLVEGYKRLSARDLRVCPACLIADNGQIYPLSVPFEEHPQGRCLIPGTQIISSAPISFVARRYDGEVVSIKTRSGKLLTVTPNHPVLTDHGWVSASRLKAGDNVISYSGQGRSAFCHPNENHDPVIVENIPSAFDMRLFDVVPISPENFHGDGKGSDVYIIWTNRLLRDTLDTTRLHPRIDQHLTLRTAQGFPLSSKSQVATMFERLFPSASGELGNADSAQLFGARRFLSQQPVGFRVGAQHNTSRFQPGTDYIPSHGIGFGESVLRFPSDISVDDLLDRQSEFIALSSSRFAGRQSIPLRPGSEQSFGFEQVRQSLVADMMASGNNFNTFARDIFADCILDISVEYFSGHVYNLQSQEQWYISNGIITHNCVAVPVVIDLPVVTWQTGLGWFLGLTDDEQRDILGPGRFDAWQSGQFELTDLVQREEDEEWGTSLQTATLQELTK